MKQELDVLALRDESLQKDKNQALIKIKEISHAINELIESALIDKTINLGDEIEDPQSLEKDYIITKITEILDTKGEIDTEVAKTVESLRSLETTYFKKVRDLEAIEEKFNVCVAIIPETDENQIKLSGEIQRLKTDLDAVNKQFEEAKTDLNSVSLKRREKFLALFDRVSDQLPANYREMTQA